MDLSKLTNDQLYEIIQNPDLNKSIRKSANDEFSKRKLSIREVQDVVARHEKQFQPKQGETLNLSFKILLILFPFFIPIQSAFAGKWLASGQKRKWRDYWFYLSLGYFIWTVAIVLLAKYVLCERSIKTMPATKEISACRTKLITPFFSFNPTTKTDITVSKACTSISSDRAII